MEWMASVVMTSALIFGSVAANADTTASAQYLPTEVSEGPIKAVQPAMQAPSTALTYGAQVIGRAEKGESAPSFMHDFKTTIVEERKSDKPDIADFQAATSDVIRAIDDYAKSSQSNQSATDKHGKEGYRSVACERMDDWIHSRELHKDTLAVEFLNVADAKVSAGLTTLSLKSAKFVDDDSIFLDARNQSLKSYEIGFKNFHFKYTYLKVLLLLFLALIVVVCFNRRKNKPTQELI